MAARSLLGAQQNLAQGDRDRLFGYLEGGGRTILTEPEALLTVDAVPVPSGAASAPIDLDVGVPARGWHGEAYRGHIFWDELFIFPFLDLRLPEVTKALLRYRHRRIEEHCAGWR